jgi:MYXO-CTERM domain-containing protein
MNHLLRSAWAALTLLALIGGASAETADLASGLQLSCDNTLTVVDGADLSLRCAGNLSLQGVLNDVRLDRSGSITLEAGNDLSLSGLTLSGASLNLTAAGRLQLTSDVTLISSGTIALHASRIDPITPTQLAADGRVTVGRPLDSGGLPGDLVVEAGGDVSLTGTPGAVTAVPEPASGLLGLIGAALIWHRARRRHGQQV